MSAGLRKLGSILALAVAGCSASVATQTPAATATLRPFLAPTRTSTETPGVAAPPTVTTPRPSPTPFMHTIQKDETLLSIAAQYGISLEELLAANPGVNPRLLSIGQQLVIPGPEGGQLIPELPTTTPVPVRLSEANCYVTLSRGLACLASVSNPGDEPVEGVVVAFTLVDREGRILSTEQADTPLNLLPAGATLPVLATFALPSEDGYVARAAVLGGLPAAHPEERYASVSLTQDASLPSEGGKMWEVSGELSVSEITTGEVRRLVVLAIGFDGRGDIVGFAESELDPAEAARGPVAYKLQLFSLGAPIEDVQVVAEASTSDSSG